MAKAVTSPSPDNSISDIQLAINYPPAIIMEIHPPDFIIEEPKIGILETYSALFVMQQVGTGFLIQLSQDNLLFEFYKAKKKGDITDKRLESDSSCFSMNKTIEQAI